MNLLKCILTANDCYQAGQSIRPIGVMVHSTGANNPTLRRYVQPYKGDENYAQLMGLLGENKNGNHWNRTGVDACVHAFVGKLADGTLASVQTLPWTMRGWHAGNGTTRPSANNTHISFEICEDGLDDPDYFARVYEEAAELTAHLCRLYGLDPLASEVVICHKEGAELGMASNHADVLHWFPKFGKSMDEFRAAVAAKLAPQPEHEEEAEMTQEKFNELMEAYLAQRSQLPPSKWSKEEREWAERMHIVLGDGQGNMSYKSFCTREEMAAFIYRLEHPADSE